MEFRRDPLLRLQSDENAIFMVLIALAQARPLVAQHDLNFLDWFAEALPAFHDERHSFPARAGQKSPHAEIGLCLRIRRHAFTERYPSYCARNELRAASFGDWTISCRNSSARRGRIASAS